jgi:hypothetical protein
LNLFYSNFFAKITIFLSNSPDLKVNNHLVQESETNTARSSRRFLLPPELRSSSTPYWVEGEGVDVPLNCNVG